MGYAITGLVLIVAGLLCALIWFAADVFRNP